MHIVTLFRKHHLSLINCHVTILSYWMKGHWHNNYFSQQFGGTIKWEGSCPAKQHQEAFSYESCLPLTQMLLSSELTTTHLFASIQLWIISWFSDTQSKKLLQEASQMVLPLRSFLQSIEILLMIKTTFNTSWSIILQWFQTSFIPCCCWKIGVNKQNYLPMPHNTIIRQYSPEYKLFLKQKKFIKRICLDPNATLSGFI